MVVRCASRGRALGALGDPDHIGVALGPMLYVATKLRSFRPDVQTPVRPTLAMIVLIVVGVGLSILARS
jgi:hypothetical protein